MVRREERTGHSMRGGGREGGPGPMGCETEQSGTTGHVKRVGRLEEDSSWDRRYLARVPTTCAQMISTRHTHGDRVMPHMCKQRCTQRSALIQNTDKTV